MVMVDEEAEQRVPQQSANGYRSEVSLSDSAPSTPHPLKQHVSSEEEKGAVFSHKAQEFQSQQPSSDQTEGQDTAQDDDQDDAEMLDEEEEEDEEPEDLSQQVAEQSPKGRFVRFNEELGRGAYKVVYKGIDHESGLEVAWNQISLLRLPTQDRTRIKQEIDLIKSLKHKNIIHFIQGWQNKEKKEVIFITEITSGTLRRYIKKNKISRLSVIKHWCQEILEGLTYLHEQPMPIIHRDLKCDNIFINANSGEIRIGDLGLSTPMNNSYTSSVLGTPEFMAPELYEEHYDIKVDIYAFGMCMLEMITQTRPYSECLSPAQIYKKVTSQEPPLALSRILDDEVATFISACLHPDKTQRPTARELLESSFIQTLDDDRSREAVKLGPTHRKPAQGKQRKQSFLLENQRLQASIIPEVEDENSGDEDNRRGTVTTNMSRAPPSDYPTMVASRQPQDSQQEEAEDVNQTMDAGRIEATIHESWKLQEEQDTLQPTHQEAGNARVPQNRSQPNLLMAQDAFLQQEPQKQHQQQQSTVENMERRMTAMSANLPSLQQMNSLRNAMMSEQLNDSYTSGQLSPEIRIPSLVKKNSEGKSSAQQTGAISSNQSRLMRLNTVNTEATDMIMGQINNEHSKDGASGAGRSDDQDSRDTSSPDNHNRRIGLQSQSPFTAALKDQDPALPKCPQQPQPAVEASGGPSKMPAISLVQEDSPVLLKKASEQRYERKTIDEVSRNLNAEFTLKVYEEGGVTIHATVDENAHGNLSVAQIGQAQLESALLSTNLLSPTMHQSSEGNQSQSSGITMRKIDTANADCTFSDPKLVQCGEDHMPNARDEQQEIESPFAAALADSGESSMRRARVASQDACFGGSEGSRGDDDQTGELLKSQHFSESEELIEEMEEEDEQTDDDHAESEKINESLLFLSQLDQEKQEKMLRQASLELREVSLEGEDDAQPLDGERFSHILTDLNKQILDEQQAVKHPHRKSQPPPKQRTPTSVQQAKKSTAKPAAGPVVQTHSDKSVNSAKVKRKETGATDSTHSNNSRRTAKTSSAKPVHSPKDAKKSQFFSQAHADDQGVPQASSGAAQQSQRAQAKVHAHQLAAKPILERRFDEDEQDSGSVKYLMDQQTANGSTQQSQSQIFHSSRQRQSVPATALSNMLASTETTHADQPRSTRPPELPKQVSSLKKSSSFVAMTAGQLNGQMRKTVSSHQDGLLKHCESGAFDQVINTSESLELDEGQTASEQDISGEDEAKAHAKRQQIYQHQRSHSKAGRKEQPQALVAGHAQPTKAHKQKAAHEKKTLSKRDSLSDIQSIPAIQKPPQKKPHAQRLSPSQNTNQNIAGAGDGWSVVTGRKAWDKPQQQDAGVGSYGQQRAGESKRLSDHIPRPSHQHQKQTGKEMQPKQTSDKKHQSMAAAGQTQTRERPHRQRPHGEAPGTSSGGGPPHDHAHRGRSSSNIAARELHGKAKEEGLPTAMNKASSGVPAKARNSHHDKVRPSHSPETIPAQSPSRTPTGHEEAKTPLPPPSIVSSCTGGSANFIDITIVFKNLKDKTVSFTFDTRNDTAEGVAREMVNELQLGRSFTRLIKHEIIAIIQQFHFKTLQKHLDQFFHDVKNVGLQSNEDISKAFEQHYPAADKSERSKRKDYFDTLAKLNKAMKHPPSQSKQQKQQQQQQQQQLQQQDEGHYAMSSSGQPGKQSTSGDPSSGH